MDARPDRLATLASLRERWGAAAPRSGAEVFGALAVAPLPGEATLPGSSPWPALLPLPGTGAAALQPPAARPRGTPDPADTDRAVPTGFPALDALLAAGGLPRAGTVALAGTGSSGATTLALRALAEAQATGALAAWIDLPRSLDPVEAVARGIRLEWLAVLVPDGLDQALAMAGTLLQARAVDVLVLDLGASREALAARLPVPADGPARPGGVPRNATGRTRPPRPAEQLGRLAAFARRAGALLLVLVPPEAPAALRAAVDEGAGLRLELRRRGWIRLGREVVGQQAEVRVAKDRRGAPDRRTTLRILYAEGGPRDRCLARDELLAEEPVAVPLASRPTRAAAPPGLPPVRTLPASASSSHETTRSTDAPPPSRLAPSRAPARQPARDRAAARRPADPGRAAVG